jgi:hypothetical protein
LFLVHYETLYFGCALDTPSSKRDQRGSFWAGRDRQIDGFVRQLRPPAPSTKCVPVKVARIDKGFRNARMLHPGKRPRLSRKRRRSMAFVRAPVPPSAPTLRYGKSKVSVCLVGPFSDCASVLAATVRFQRSSSEDSSTRRD